MKPDFGQRPIGTMQFNRRLFLDCSLWECYVGPHGILVAIPLMTSGERKKKIAILQYLVSDSYSSMVHKAPRLLTNSCCFLQYFHI